MRKIRLLCICFIILGIVFLMGCEEIVPPIKPTPTPQYEVGKYGESRFGQAVFGTEDSKIINNLWKEK